MIVKMRRAFVVARRPDRSRLLEVMRDLGVMHLAPVDSAKAVAKSETLRQIDHLDRAMQILGGIVPSGNTPDAGAVEAAEGVLQMQRDEAEKRSRLTTLTRQIEQLEMWGDVRLEQFRQLKTNGVDVSFYAAAAEQIGAFKADLVQPLRELPDRRSLLAVVVHGGETEIPDQAERIELPKTDRPAVRNEAKQIDEALKAQAERLADLAGKLPEMTETRARLQAEADYTVAQRGGLSNDDLFAMQGWVPAESAETLSADVAAAGLEAVVQVHEPTEEDDVPTLIRYPRWAKPIRALFDVLGTTPGYQEYDLAPFFMVALPLFTAMLIGDAGYGMIFTLIGLKYYKTLAAKAGKPAPQLIIVFGLATMAWGILTANFFGVTPNDLEAAGGMWAKLGSVMAAPALLWSKDPKTARDLIIKISFIIGCVHLVSAHLRAAIGLAPNLKFVAQLGWSVFLVGMLAVIWMLFFPQGVWMPKNIMFLLLAGGFAMVVLFSYPSRNPAKVLGLGLIANIMPLIATFSDTISYIRLMAVGLASYYIASAFNGLAAQVGGASPWLIPAAALIVVLAHALNITLGIIAIFAHGVRLNMLEFSSNAGVQWQGSPYAPFAKTVKTTV